MACHTGVVSTSNTTLDAVVYTAETLLGARVKGKLWLAYETLLISLRCGSYAILSGRNATLSITLSDLLIFT